MSHQLRITALTESSTILITPARHHSAAGTFRKSCWAATTKKSAVGVTSKPSKKPSATVPTFSLAVFQIDLTGDALQAPETIVTEHALP
jgi:hypothetical protein